MSGRDSQTGRSAGLDVSKIPPVVGWARPLSRVPINYCGVIEIDLPFGSIATACRGRWSVNEPTHIIHGRERTTDHEGVTFTKCGACDELVRLQRTNEGLAELKHAAVIETRPFPDFDLSDGGDA